MNCNVVFQDFPKICRICLNKEEILKLLTETNLLDIFKSITNIEIRSEDNLPRNICNTCINKLESIATFINLCKINEANLKEIEKKANTDIYLEDNSCHSDGHDVSDPSDDIVENENENKHSADLNNASTESLTLPVLVDKEATKSTRHSTKRQPSSCEVCSENFSTKRELTEHQKKNDCCKSKPYKCMNCEKAFFRKFSLNLHMRSHTKEMPFECKICEKKFRFAQNLRRHISIAHMGSKQFKCDICGREFARSERKIQHMNIHTDRCPYKCRYCAKCFKHRSTYRNHITAHKVKNGELEDLSEIECHICKKIFFSKQMLQSHIEIHIGEKKYLCSICGKNFLKKCYLDAHSRIHTGEKPFECKECGKKFKYASGYKSHTLFHTGERSYKCDICLKTFKQSAHLRSHFKTHTGEKPFKCSFCGKDFAYNSNLKTHTRIHTGETPFHCPICDKGFYDSSSMKKHLKGH